MCYSGYGAVTNILQMVISRSYYTSHVGPQRLCSALSQGLSLQSTCDLAAASPKTLRHKASSMTTQGSLGMEVCMGAFLPPQPETGVCHFYSNVIHQS